jgi:hypothetical protein
MISKRTAAMKKGPTRGPRQLIRRIKSAVTSDWFLDSVGAAFAKFAQFGPQPVAQRALSPQLVQQSFGTGKRGLVVLAPFEQLPPTADNFLLGKHASHPFGKMVAITVPRLAPTRDQ